MTKIEDEIALILLEENKMSKDLFSESEEEAATEAETTTVMEGNIGEKPSGASHKESTLRSRLREVESWCAKQTELCWAMEAQAPEFLPYAHVPASLIPVRMSLLRCLISCMKCRQDRVHVRSMQTCSLHGIGQGALQAAIG